MLFLQGNMEDLVAADWSCKLTMPDASRLFCFAFVGATGHKQHSDLTKGVRAEPGSLEKDFRHAAETLPDGSWLCHDPGRFEGDCRQCQLAVISAKSLSIIARQ